MSVCKQVTALAIGELGRADLPAARSDFGEADSLQPVAFKNLSQNATATNLHTGRTPPLPRPYRSGYLYGRPR